MGGEPVPRVYGLGAEASAQRGIFRKGAPSNHDAGSGAHAHRKETMMRFYKQPPDQQPIGPPNYRKLFWSNSPCDRNLGIPPAIKLLPTYRQIIDPAFTP